jgi:hypothetical protein
VLPVPPACAPTMSLWLSVVSTAAVRWLADIVIRSTASARPLFLPLLLLVSIDLVDPAGVPCLHLKLFLSHASATWSVLQYKAREKSEVAAWPAEPDQPYSAEPTFMPSSV